MTVTGDEVATYMELVVNSSVVHDTVVDVAEAFAVATAEITGACTMPRIACRRA